MVDTLAFSNLAVAVRGVEGGRSVRLALDPVTVGRPRRGWLCE
jgi:hypothetical protein